MRKLDKKLNGILAFLSLLILLMVIFIRMTTISEQEIVQNYNKHKTGFVAVENFVRKLTPRNYLIKLIGFNSKNSINIIIWERKGNSSEKIIDEWDVPVNDPRVTACLTRINWTEQDLMKLYELLSKINCYSVGYASSHIGFDDVIELGYRKRLFSTPHVYFIFQDTISKEEIEKKYYSDAKIYYLDNRIAWTYLTFG